MGAEMGRVCHVARLWLKLRAFLAVCVDELPSVRDVAAEMVMVSALTVKGWEPGGRSGDKPVAASCFQHARAGHGQLMSQVAQLWRDRRLLDTVSSIHVENSALPRNHAAPVRQH